MSDENIGRNYTSQRAHIKIALDGGSLEKAFQKYIELKDKYAVSNSGQISLRRKPKQKQPLAKITTPSEIKPKPTKKDKAKVDYNNAEKRKNRNFVGQDFDGDFHPVKKALLLPSEDLDGIVQFFEMGLFDENTQLICVERRKDIFENWQDDNGRGFGTNLRLAQKRQGKHSIADAVAIDHQAPILIHGEIGEHNKDGEWQVDLADIDEIDFVWLDFMGTLKPRYIEWIEEVLRDKTQKNATVNITVMSRAVGKLAPTVKIAKQKRDMIDRMVSDGLIDDELLESIMENETDEKSLEMFRTDNVLIANALKFDDQASNGFWVRRSQDVSLNADVLGETDITTYTGSKLEMATHKFCRAYEVGGDGTPKPMGKLLNIDECVKLMIEADENLDPNNPKHIAFCKFMITQAQRQACGGDIEALREFDAVKVGK